MSDRSFITWPFFAPRHAVMLDRLDGWAQANVAGLVDHHDIDGSCRKLVAALGEAGFLDIAAPPADQAFDVRSLCLARERLAWHAGLCRFRLPPCRGGSGPGRSACSARPPAEGGVPAPGGGRQSASPPSRSPKPKPDPMSAAMATTARADGHDHYVIDGEKTWISNGGIADHYVAFAPAPARRPARRESRPSWSMRITPGPRDAGRHRCDRTASPWRVSVSRIAACRRAA